MVTYLEFLRFIKKIYKNINWMNKSKIQDFRQVYIKHQNEIRLTKYYFDKVKMLELLKLKKDKNLRVNSKDFWIYRGWSEEVANARVGEHQSMATKKGYERIGCSTASKKYLVEIKGYAFDAADKEIKSRKRFSFSDLGKDERVKLAKKAANIKNTKMQNLKELNPTKYYSKFNTRIEYYLACGMELEEARQELYNRQNTISLEKFIQRYGYDEGMKRFNKRNEKWLKTLSDKPDDEKLRINSAKSNSYLSTIEKYGPIQGYIKYTNRMKFRKCATSREAVNFFNLIINERIVEFGENLIWNDMNTNRKEYCLNDGQIFYFYDFVDLDNKIIIEYNGKAFHPNKNNMSVAEWDNWKHPFLKIGADETYAKDRKKIEFAEQQGFRVVEVWSDDPIEFSFGKIKDIYKNVK